MASGKALVITASGGTDVFQLVSDFSIPAPAEGELIVKLVATSVNPVDVYVRSGGYPSPVFPKVIKQLLIVHLKHMLPFLIHLYQR